MAGGSGVGSFGIQIAHAAGCRVMTKIGGEAKKAKALEIGAFVAINHYKEDIAARVKVLTGGAGAYRAKLLKEIPLGRFGELARRPRSPRCCCRPSAGPSPEPRSKWMAA